jgi:hypothetical protein
VSVHKKGKGWVVRWRDSDGSNRSRSFSTRKDANQYDREGKERERQSREAKAIRDTLELAKDSDATELRQMAKTLRVWANTDWEIVKVPDLYLMRTQNRVADALERRAEALDKGQPVTMDFSERVRPTGVVDEERAEGGASFLVVSRVPDAEGGGHRAIHDGFFLTIGAAETYRLEQTNADQLSVLVLHDLYPIRDATEAERATGELDSAEDKGELIEKIYREVDARS